MVSIKDIAKACGVSAATVSKALHDQKDVSEETKERVRQTAKELGYLPNAAARALKTNRSKNIGVLYSEDAGMDLTHEYFAGVLNGVKAQAEELGYDITFINNKRNERMSYLEHCLYRNFDGVVIVCADFNDKRVVELMNGELPVVTVDYVYHNCTAVSSNNVQGMTDLMNYIISQGHEKIAYIHGQDYSSVTKERLTAYYKALEDHGLACNEQYIKEAEYLKVDGVSRKTRELLSLEDRPTCIIYPDDRSIIGGINVLREMGLKVPDDISIAGYDGSSISQMLSPKITTIRQDTDRIGREAAERLVKIINKPKTTLIERVVVEGILLKGESVGVNS